MRQLTYTASGGLGLLLLLLLAAPAACDLRGADEDVAAADPRTRETAAAIVGGTDSTAADDAAVLILTHVASRDTPQSQFVLNCTGTLLAPNLILTARHCVSATSEGTFACNLDGTLHNGPGGSITDDLPVTEMHVLAGPKLPDSIALADLPGHAAALVHDAATVVCNADVALIVLAQPIANAVIAPIRLDAPVTKDEMLVVVGWGATETSFFPTVRQRRTGVTAVTIGPDPTPFLGGQLDSKEFRASESVCFGDSGGPAFDATTHAVVGVVSRGANGGVTTSGSGCVGTEHVFMQTAPFKALVLEGYAKAGATPWLEGQPRPQSDAGAPEPGGSGAEGGAPAPSDAATPEATAPAPTSSTSASGCAVGPLLGDAPRGAGARLSPALGIAGALALLLASRRRRALARAEKA